MLRRLAVLLLLVAAVAIWAVVSASLNGRPADDALPYIIATSAFGVGVVAGLFAAAGSVPAAGATAFGLLGVLLLVGQSGREVEGSLGETLAYANAMAALAVQVGAVCLLAGASDRSRRGTLVRPRMRLRGRGRPGGFGCWPRRGSASAPRRRVGPLRQEPEGPLGVHGGRADNPRRRAGPGGIHRDEVLAPRPGGGVVLATDRPVGRRLGDRLDQPVDGAGPRLLRRAQPDRSRPGHDCGPFHPDAGVSELGIVGVALVAAVMCAGLVLLQATTPRVRLIAVTAWTAVWLHSLVDYTMDFPLVVFTAGATIGIAFWMGLAAEEASAPDDVS